MLFRSSTLIPLDFPTFSTVHIVSGQTELQNALARDEDFATLSVLKQYERWRMWENLVVLGLTDTLTRVFSNKIYPIVIVRRLSLLILKDISPVRSLVLKHMQGLTGKAPRIVALTKENCHVDIRRTVAR